MNIVMKALVLEYLAIALGFLFTGDQARCLYFLAAAVLNLTVMYMA